MLGQGEGEGGREGRGASGTVSDQSIAAAMTSGGGGAGQADSFFFFLSFFFGSLVWVLRISCLCFCRGRWQLLFLIRVFIRLSSLCVSV